MDSISKRIKQAMEIKAINQTKIIEKTGINKGALSCYINGKYEPKQTNIYLIAKALDVSPVWLMGHDVPMEPVADTFMETKKEESDIPILHQLILDDLKGLTDNKLYQIINFIKTLK